MTAKIIVYSKAFCPYCDKAKALLQNYSAPFDEIRLDLDPDAGAEMFRTVKRSSVPQIFINGKHIGGCDDLYALHEADELSALIDHS